MDDSGLHSGWSPHHHPPTLPSFRLLAPLSPTHPLSHLPTRSLTLSLTHSSCRLLAQSAHPLTHSLTLTCDTHAHSLTHSLPHSLTHSLTHSLSHVPRSFIHSRQVIRILLKTMIFMLSLFGPTGPVGLLAGAEKLAFTSILAGVAVLGLQVCACTPSFHTHSLRCCAVLHALWPRLIF